MGDVVQKEVNGKAKQRKLGTEELQQNMRADSLVAESDISECEPAPSISINPTVKRHGRREIVTAELSAALDPTKKKDRMAMHIITNAAQSLRQIRRMVL